MHSLNLIPPTMAAVSETIRDTGSAFVVAGGYPRDLYFNREPKDADFWVFWRTEAQYRALSQLLLDTYDFDDCIPFYTNEDKPDDPNTAVIHCVMRTPKLDVIMLNEKCENTLDLVNRFDCTLNRFVMSAGQPYYVTTTGDFIATAPLCFRQQHRTNPKREAKMKEKCLDLTGEELILL